MNTDNRITPDTSYEEILKQASKQKSFEFGFAKAYPAYIILVVTILLSLGGWFLVDQRVRTDRNVAFDKAVSSVMNRLELKYRNDYQVLQSMRSLYDNYVQVVRDVFELYGTIPTRTYPSIMTIMYAPVVKPEALEEYIYYVRSQGYYEYQIMPEGVRNIYYPVEYVVPLEKNLHRSGFDLGTVDQIKVAIEKAKENNLLTSTPVFSIRPPDTLGFFLISPIYHRDASLSSPENLASSFEGVLVLEIDSRTFFETALGSGVATDTSIVFQCLEKSGNKETLVFESDNADLLDTKYKPYISTTRYFQIADRKVPVEFHSIPNFGGTFQQLLPILTFIIGLLISFGFSAFILSIISSRTRAVDLAERMTRSQRRILESSNDIIAVMDLNGIWRSMNPASLTVFGSTPAELIGKKAEMLLADPHEKEKFNAIIFTDQEELTDRIDTQVLSKDEVLKWVSWSLTVSKVDGYIYCIGRDITLEKIAEEEAILRGKQNKLAEQLAREVSEYKTYFMLKLSHQLRNLLTGMMGYLQLLSQKVWENEEEHDNFVELAVQSSEELYTFVSDIDDVAGGEKGTDKMELSYIQIARFLNQVKENINTNTEEVRSIKFELIEGKDAGAVADVKFLLKSFVDISNCLTDGLEDATIKIHATENPFEAATEIQILGPVNNWADEMIDIYNKNLSTLMTSLKHDKKDIILKLSLAASTIRMMNGNMKVDSLGEDGSAVMITLPLHKPQD
jgi:PAS domain S-box-containing protein